MKSPIFSKEKLLYFPQKPGIVPIFSNKENNVFKDALGVKGLRF